jgi:two-component system phosphate regulon sensor histidine kinase PhoR
MKLTLMHKGLLLVSIPVCFEIGMFSALIYLQEQVEHEARRLDHKRQVNESVNTIIRDVAKIGLQKKRYIQGTASAERIRKYIENLLKEFTKLEQLTKDDPELLRSVLLSKKAVLDARDEFRNVRIELQKVRSPEEFTAVLVASRKRLDAALASALNAGVLDLANKTEQGADLEKNVQARHQITIVLRNALWISVLLGILSAFWYSRSLTLRIMQLKENASLFAFRKPLKEVMTGNDEITELDKAFHEATRLIETATRKERAILENASDLIFSVDEDLLITSANPSAEATIGKTLDKLVGRSLASIFSEQDEPKLANEFAQMVSSGHKAEFEVLLLRENATPLNVVVSASYSPRDQSFYCILHDVTAQREMENLRREVVAMITHDLRTPLQTIQNYLEMLKSGMLGTLTAQGDKLLNLTDRESHRMATLVDSVLTLEKLRSGTMTITVDNVDLFGLLDSCIKALQLTANEKDIALDIQPFDPIEVRGDQVWLEQILINIVSNAVKFSPSHTQVSLSVTASGENAEIRIMDQGPGIPAEDLPKIFDRFHRVSATAHREGSGLGLSICQELIHLHHGSISCESEPGHGSTFIIVLPLASRVEA